MDFILELIFGIFFEVPAEALMESKRVKTWVKTTLYLLLGLSLSVLFGFMAYSVTTRDGNLSGGIVAGVICAVWTVFVIWSAIYSHKRKWRKD